MRVKHLICLVFFLVSYTLLRAHSNQDSIKIRKLATLAKESKKTDPEKAIQYCVEGIELAQNANREYDEAILKNRLGTIQLQLGDYSNAANQFYDALTIFRDLNLPARVASTLNNLGILYKKQERFEDAILFFRQSYSHYKSTQNLKKQATLLNNIGLIHKNLNELDSAQFYYLSALEINRKLNNKIGMGNNYHNLGNLFRMNGSYQKSINYYDSAWVLKNELNDISGKLKVSWNKSIAEYELNLNKPETENNLKNIYHEAIDRKLMPIAHGVARDLSELYAKTSDIDSAYKYLVLANELKEKLVNINTSKLLDNLSLRLFEKENKEAISALEERNNAQAKMLKSEKQFNQLLLVGLSVLALLSTLVLFLFYLNQKNSKKLLEQHQRIDEANKNLELINADLKEMSKEKEILVSMVAHDLKSPIDQIKGLLELLKLELEEKMVLGPEQHKYFEATRESINRVYSLISDIISSRKKKEKNIEEIQLHEFIEGVSSNFKVLADKKNIRFVFNLTEDCKVKGINGDKLTRVVENLLSNAIKYSPEESSIEFMCGTKNGKVLLSIKDEGSGISPEQIESIKSGIGIQNKTATKGSHGIGLQIVAKFLNDIDAKLEIESSLDKGGSTFTIIFP